MRRFGGVLLGAILCAMLPAAGAHAQSLDFQLWRLGDPDSPGGAASPGMAQYSPSTAGNCPTPAQGCRFLVPYDPHAQERFARFATDLAFAVTPLPSGLSSTAGDAGFDASLSLDFAFIHPIQRFSDGTVGYVWPTASVPSSTQVLPTVHLRKGLPLSFQIGTDVSYLVNSSVFIPTVWVQWSIVEGHKWIPDFHVRGLGSVLLGTGDLEEIVAGWDLGASYKIPIAGRVVAAAYLGYEQLGLSATTGNVNFDPRHDNTASPSNLPTNQLASSNVFASLDYGNPFVPTTLLSRFYFGAQVKWSIVLVGLDFAYGWANNSIGEGYSTQYSLSSWKMAVRAGLMF